MRQISFPREVQKNKLKLVNSIARGGIFKFSGSVIFSVVHTLRETVAMSKFSGYV